LNATFWTLGARPASQPDRHVIEAVVVVQIGDDVTEPRLSMSLVTTYM
jgi:hypothetical protein